MNQGRFYILLSILVFMGCKEPNKSMKVQIFETSSEGKSLKEITDIEANVDEQNLITITIDSSKKYQTITGFGAAFTESSAHLLNQLSKSKRDEVLKAYFSADGANYSLTRTHMNSCDFSLKNYSYAPVEDDITLEHFSVEEDKADLIPMIKDAMNFSPEGFKLIASPWTAPPWMKDNNDWKGGKLLPKYNDTWALFFSKYIEAYKEEGIDIWGFTVENEPLGNDSNWDSMHFSAEEMTDFVQNHLGPKLEADGHDVKILGYDQNREHLKHWVDVMFQNEQSSKYFDGTAVHWYASTYEVFPNELQYAHNKAPEKLLIQTEACIDAEVPKWKDDTWYWQKEATDWGWDWAPDDQKYLHPKYAPVNRYARDIIGCLNNWVDGWVDWNMVLDTKGGPNWASNWCIAPVIVNTEKDEVYYTPLFYVMSHFSKFIRPGANIVDVTYEDEDLMITAAINQDNGIAVVIFNPAETSKALQLSLKNNSNQSKPLIIGPKSIQTILIPTNQTS